MKGPISPMIWRNPNYLCFTNAKIVFCMETAVLSVHPQWYQNIKKNTYNQQLYEYIKHIFQTFYLFSGKDSKHSIFMHVGKLPVYTAATRSCLVMRVTKISNSLKQLPSWETCYVTIWNKWGYSNLSIMSYYLLHTFKYLTVLVT